MDRFRTGSIIKFFLFKIALVWTEFYSLVDLLSNMRLLLSMSLLLFSSNFGLFMYPKVLGFALKITAF